MSPPPDRIPSVGLHVLYEPEKSASTLVDVVFVHGFGGHSMRSWQYDEQPAPNLRTNGVPPARGGSRNVLLQRTNSSDKAHRPNIRAAVTRNNTWHPESRLSPSLFWPRDLLPVACPEARIITWGYHTLRSGNMPVVAQPDLFSHVNDLLRELGDIRYRTNAQQRPLVFIAHSLGGIIVKEVLRQAEFSSMKNEQDILISIAGVIFFGCPHRAADQASLAETAVSMAEECWGIKTDGGVLSALCGVNNPRWGEAQESFIRLWHHFNFVTKTYQEKQVDTNNLINSHAESSQLGDPSENAESLPTDHRSMCQFKSASDAGFKSLSKILQDMVRNEKLKHQALSAIEIKCLQQLTCRRVERPHLAPTGSSLNTCRRICNTRQFCDWYRRQDGSNANLLWLTGTSGSGKSTQLRQIWCQMEKQWKPATTSIIYSFAENHADQAFVSEPGLGGMRSVATIRFILSQLFAQDLNLRQELSRLCEGDIDDATLIRLFLDDYIKSKRRTLSRRTFVLVDAGSACDDAHIGELLYYLCQMALSSNFSVCLTSRSIGGNLPSNITRLELEKYNTGDIEWAVQPRLRGSWEQRSVTVKRLVDKARGSFLWAQLATNFLNKFIDDGEAQSLVAQVLENLPTGLNELFEWTLGTLMPKEKADATTIMRWVMLSPEPMMLNDLQMAVRLSRTNFLLCRDPQSALDVGSPWSMQELQKTGKQFDTPSQFYQWLRSRTCGLLEARPADGESKAQQSLGLQRVYPINDSVRSFFMSGRGFAALSSGRATTTPPSHEAVDLCHYSLLRTILIYLNTSDLSPLVSGHRLPELRQGILSAEPSPAWRKNVVDQRNLVMSSYPFLRYAVDHLLYHLLSPRPLRYFLPQQAIFNTLAANDCRIWRRWTALLGETDALAVLARCHSAQPLLRPEFGASFRLERVFRAVNKIAAGESWFSPHQSPGPPTSSTAPVSRAPRGEEEKTARQKPHTAPRPPSLPIASHTTRRGPRSRGTVVVTRRR